MISCKEQEISRKRLSNGVPKSDLKLGNVTLAPLVAPLAPQVVFLLKNVAKVLQKWSQACKSDSKSESKVAKVGAR